MEKNAKHAQQSDALLFFEKRVVHHSVLHFETFAHIDKRLIRMKRLDRNPIQRLTDLYSTVSQIVLINKH